jgi:hypothetical protein
MLDEGPSAISRARAEAAREGPEGPERRVPGMGTILEVQVLPRADHSERSETQLREGDRSWRGSVNRNREPMDKNQIRGDA